MTYPLMGDPDAYYGEITPIAHNELTIDLELDLLALQLTNNPNPVRFDGVPLENKSDGIMLASIGSLTGILTHSIVAQTPESKIYYYINDHLGTPMKVIDENNTVAWSADYKPFGEANITVDTFKNNFRFPGQYFDKESKLHYNYYRYYQPSIGRYLRADPIGLEGGINLFTYASFNPIGFDDFWGLLRSRRSHAEALAEFYSPENVLRRKLERKRRMREHFNTPEAQDFMRRVRRQNPSHQPLSHFGPRDMMESYRDFANGYKMRLTINKECIKCSITCLARIAFEPPGGELYTQIYSRLVTALAKRVGWRVGTYAIPILGNASSIYSGFRAIHCLAICVSKEQRFE